MKISTVTTVQPHKAFRPGSLLIEMTVALGLLVAIGMSLLIGSLDVIKPRNWTIIQNLTDSYLTYEEAYAKRIPFDDLVSNTSEWQNPGVVEVGKISGGKKITGTVKRILVAVADPTNGDATTNPNPLQMETYTIYSVLTYKIGNKEYVKSRTIIRSR